MRSLKTTLALGVLGLGVAGAWTFRKDGETKPSTAVVDESRLVLRESASFQPFNDEGLKQFQQAIEPESPVAPAPPPPEPAARSPLDRSVAPPVIADSYAAATVADVAFAGLLDRQQPIQSSPPTTADTGTVLHQISDGDTLASLAETYLDASSRAREIYESNRDVLPGPDILPIGVRLKIVLRAASADSMDKQARSAVSVDSHK